MEKFRKTVICLLGVLFATAVLVQESFGGGFALYEWGARGQTLGGAMTARADDPSAVAYNPAGITQLEGLNILGGLSLVSVKADLQTTNMYDGNTSKVHNDNTFQPLPHIYFTTPINDRLYFGAGAFTRFGLGVEWPEDWAGRYATTDAELITFSVNNNLAYQVTEKFSVAVGLEIMYVDLHLENYVDANKILAAGGAPVNINDPNTSDMDVKSELNGDDTAFGYNIGFHYIYSDALSIGAHYRRRVDVKASGDLRFDEPSHTVRDMGLAGLFQNTGISGEVTLPDMLFTGVMFRPLPDLSIELGATWTHWSLYDELTIDYDSTLLGQEGTVSEKNWDSTWRYSLGVEWNATDRLALRASYVFDETPVDYQYSDYLVPDSDRHMFGLGLGYNISDIHIDIGYLYIDFDSHSTPNRQIEEGIPQTEYKEADAHIIGLSVSKAF